METTSTITYGASDSGYYYFMFISFPVHSSWTKLLV